MKKIIKKIALLAVLMLPLGIALPALAVVGATWNTTGSYVVNMNYLGTDYAHDMNLVQDGLGNLTGNGGSPSLSNVYTWTITSGTVSGNSVDFLANYTATPDAVTPQTVLHVLATIALDGTMSGTWSDNYQGGERTGTLTTVSGAAVPLGSLSAEDFGVVNYDTGLGMLKGYSAGFGLTDATFAGATSVVVKLYSAENALLQTNTAIFPKFNTDITGTQFSSPFDVSGNFDYATDGYWANVRETQFGQSTPATRVVATVTLANGKIVTAENTNMVGDATTIYPVIITPTDSTVHIFKLIDGVQATTANANSVSFPMFTSTYNAPFTLGPGGWTTGDIDYEASTSPMALGSSYSANEVLTTPLVGTTCDADHTYSLIGYGVGNTLPEAVAATPSITTPSFTNLQGDKYIVVRNHKCETTTPPTTETGHIIIAKSTLPNNTQDFLFTNNFENGNPATFSLDDDGDATLSNMRDSVVLAGTYSVSETEVTGWSSVSATCSDGSPVSAIVVSAGETVVCMFINAKTAPASPSISGMKYNDLNRNGKKDTNEPGLSGWVIKLKGNNTVVSTTTDANGNYDFVNITPGTYKVREVHKNGWKRMSKNPKNIVISADSVVTGVNFGNAKKQKYEKEDSEQDDNRNEQSGNYFGNHGRSNYERDQNRKDHSNR